MGLALAAELNGYPGPRHVLDLADKLELSAEQKERMQKLFDSMKAEAEPLGEKLLAQEAALNKQFAEQTITPESLKAATAEIGLTQAQLRSLTDREYTLGRTSSAIFHVERIYFERLNAAPPHA